MYERHSILKCCSVRLRRSDAHRAVESHDKYLSISDVARVRGLGDRLDSLVDQLARHRDFNFDLGQQSRRIFSAAIQFRKTLLPPVSLDFRSRHYGDDEPET